VDQLKPALINELTILQLNVKSLAQFLVNGLVQHFLIEAEASAHSFSAFVFEIDLDLDG